MRKSRLFGVVAVGIAATLYGGFFGAKAAGYRFNFTDSAPIGLWLVEPLKSGLTRGQLVEVCPPNQQIVSLMVSKGYLGKGYCPNGAISLLKSVSALPGDVVVINKGKPVVVNNEILPFTESLDLLPGWNDGAYTVEPGAVWVFSTYSKGSFDSRYFGPIPLENIKGTALPVVVKGSPLDMNKRILRGGL